MTRWAVAVASPTSGERCWVTPTGRLAHEAWRAYTAANSAKVTEFAARCPKFWELEVVEAPDTRPPAAEAAPQKVGDTPILSSRASDWAGTDETGIQQRTKADGSTVFRSRARGRVSETFTSIEDAQRWREAQP